MTKKIKDYCKKKELTLIIGSLRQETHRSLTVYQIKLNLDCYLYDPERERIFKGKYITSKRGIIFIPDDMDQYISPEQFIKMK